MRKPPSPRRLIAGLATTAVALLGLALPVTAATSPVLPLVVEADSAVQAASPQQVAVAVAAALADQTTAGQALSPLSAAAPAEATPVAEVIGDSTALALAADQAAELSVPDQDGDLAVFLTAPLGAEVFSVAGVTWQDGPAPGRVLARAYPAGEWSDWYDLDSDDGPDPSSPEGQAAARASSPLVAAGATGLQIQVLSQVGEALPEGLAAAVVPLEGAELAAAEAGEDPAADSAAEDAAGHASAGAAGASQGAGALALTQPTIKPRSAWNAAAADYSGNTPKGQPEVAPQLKGAIIHHQAGTNTYTEAQVPGIIRSIQSWHMGNNGWNDIGYNFLVDKFGVLWEGRQGGITTNVVGAHATNFNTGSTGLCFLGDLDKVEPTEAALKAGGDLVAWRLALAGITSLLGNTVYPKDPQQSLKPIVAGHRDVQATTCPGRYLYAKLDVIRNHAVELPGPAKVKTWTTASPDLTGDGRGDLVVIDEDGLLFVYPMLAGPSLGQPSQAGHGWSGWRVLAPGDWDGDGNADLMGVAPDGKLYLYGGPGFSSRREVGHGWSGLTVRPAGDVSGDGKPDLLAINDITHKLYIYKGNGRGGWITGGGEEVGHGWADLALHAAGDVNGDGRNDIFAVTQEGDLYTYLSRPGGTFQPKVKSGHGWQHMVLYAGADMDGDRKADLVGLHPSTNRLLFYKGVSNQNFGAAQVLATNW
ncbi:MAG: FG-GAP-like repeat-containing protein [Bifidobacteriaceae bacterium]|jgi:hypothetical protein|nr:FG-GAP-like repeat-containing protein [Bifidobacteriaceae bacterium]